MITRFDTTTANLLQKELVEALQAVAEKHGLRIVGAGGTINSDISMISKFKVEVADAGAKEDGRKKEFEMYCDMFDLKPEHFGATFKSRGNTYRISGLELKRRKFPVRAIDVATNKELLFTTDVVRFLSAA